MNFQQILLFILHKFNGERSQTAPYYLLKGKKSGQTIQDLTYFQLHPFFSLHTKLKKESYDEVIMDLVQNKYVQIENSFIHLTEKGFLEVKKIRIFHYNGWLYRGNEQIFWSRVELVVQTISHFQANEKKFIPNQKNEDIHQFVKMYLRRRDFQAISFYTSFKEQLISLLKNPLLGDFHRELFVNRLSGFGCSGFTWEQLAVYYDKSVLDIKFAWIECLHILLDNITKEDHPDLFDLTNGIQVEILLTDSALKTNNLFVKGYTVEHVAAMRSLKLNTIEDHIIEIVSVYPEFQVEAYITMDQLQQAQHISTKFKTKKLKVIREHLPEMSYFQIRIALTKGEETNG